MNRIDQNYAPLRWLLAFLMSALLAACGGGQDPILGSGNVGLAPTVTAAFPAPNATGVAINTRIITAAFTLAMDPATLTATSFTLTCPGGTAQTGTAGYVTAGNVATLTLGVANSLPVSSICTATITTGAKSSAGIPLDSNFVWKFTTGLAPDTTAPTVTATVNAGGATGVALNTKVGATFSEAMDPLTINATTFTLKQGTNAVAGSVTYAGVNALFAPAGSLAPNTAYTVTATTGVKDLSGNPMASNFVWSWTTGAAPDTTAPSVVRTTNANGATLVPVNTQVGATFSEGMDPLTITNLNVTLKEAVSGVPVAGTLSYSGVQALFVPLNSLAYNTRYTATVKSGATGVKDLAGNPMASDYVWSWTTGLFLDTIAPTIILTDPVANAPAVPLGSPVAVYFSELMDPLTITTASLKLECPFGAGVAGTLQYFTVNRNVAILIPTNPLPANTTCTASLASSAKDLAGNSLVSGVVPNPWNFVTGSAPVTTTTAATTTTTAGGTTTTAGATTTTTAGATTTTTAGATTTTTTATTTTTTLVSTGVCVGAACVPLGTAGTYVALTKTGISTVGTTSITGNVGVSPASATAITGFGLIADSTNTFSTSSLVTGKVYAANFAPPTPSNISTAISDMEAAYTAANAKAPSGVPACPGVGAMSDATDGGPLAAGVYTCAVNATIPANLTLNGSATDVWVFRITGTLSQATATSVLLTGGARAENVFWSVSGTVNIGANAHMEGVILAQTNISLQNGASLKGRFLAQTAVTLDGNTIVGP